MQSGTIRPIPNMFTTVSYLLLSMKHSRETVRKFYEKEVVPNIENMRNNNMLTVTYGTRRVNLGLL